jgi:glyoxylase-like metal-dependent hydrolase (beta-lactamase superfamily II)
MHASPAASTEHGPRICRRTNDRRGELSGGEGARIAFRQLHDTTSGTFTYLVADLTRHAAALLDPVQEHATLYLALLEELGLELHYVLETHDHEDHASAREALQDACGARAVLGRDAGPAKACLRVGHGDAVRIGRERMQVLATPGHTPGCISYLWRDRVFTGDALLIGGCGRTDLPGGDPGRLYDSVVRRLLTLSDETLVYPGRGSGGRRVSCIGEEREHNPWVTGRSRDEFVALMDRCRGPRPAAPARDAATLAAVPAAG